MASGNLVRTYLSLGRASERSQILEEDGFEGCIGPTPHPVCNFAVGLNLGPADAGRLAALAGSRPQFNIYACGTDRPADLAERLQTAGFRKAYRLCQMVAEPGKVPSGLAPTRATALEERDAAAGFMMREFFGRSDGPSRDAVRRATAAAEELELYGVEDNGARVAAAMLSRSESMVGLYNLCVRKDLRGQGWGRAVVMWVLAQASDSEWVTLQCDAALEGWYQRLGFRSIGSVDVYVWDRSAELL